MTNFVMKNIVKMKKIIENKRKELGIKIYELANKLAIDSSLMSRILSGERMPTDKQLLQLSQLLSIDYNDLIKEKLQLQIMSILGEYPEMAEDVLKATEERISYLSSENKFEIIDTAEVDDALEELTNLQTRWSNKKPLNPLQLEKMKEYFHTEYTYNSNKIEGNTLSFQETHLVVNEGITIGGKSVKEHLEVINHQEAIDLIIDFVSNKIDFNESVLKQIHQLILKGIDKRGAGVYRTVPVMISGSLHNPPAPFLLDSLMEDYFRFYRLHKNKLHPVVLAAEMHERLVSIHPFIDGNGRTSRLVMNLILLQNGFTIVNLKGSLEDRQQYYKSLEAVQVNHESRDFYNLIIERAKDSLEKHLNLAGV